MAEVPAAPDPLTPFVGALKRRVGEEARGFLGLADQDGLRFRVHRLGLDLRLAWEQDEVTLEVRDPPTEDPRAWRAGTCSLRVRAVRGKLGDIRAPRLRRHLADLKRRCDEGAMEPQPLLAAAAALRPYAEVHDHFYRSLEVTTGGSGAMLRLGFRCNQDCAFCWQGRDWPAPPDDLYWTWLDEIGSAGVEWLTLSGGEPTLYRRLPELIERARRVHGLRVSMQTNAVQLSKPGYAERLVEAGLESVLVSLHAHEARLSDAMTRAPGTHVRTIAGTHRALAAGLQVGFNCLVERENVTQLPALAEFIVSEFAQQYPGGVVTVNLSQAGDYHEVGRVEAHFVALDTVRAPLVHATRTLRAAGIPVETCGTCGFPACVFHGNEDLLPAVPEARDAQHMSARTTSANACSACSLNGDCVGVRKAYLERFGEAGLLPFGRGSGAAAPR